MTCDLNRLGDLRRELDRRAALPVRFHHWDPFILGDDAELRSEVLPAGEIGRREAMRWREGRFPSVQLAVADAVFSKQREYKVAVRTGVRPFARAFARMPLAEFAAIAWTDVYTRIFEKPPKDGVGTPHHLSGEGRIKSIMQGSRVLHRIGIETAEQARRQLATPGGETRIRGVLGQVSGLGPALRANVLMNLGRLTIKADVHVIAALAPYLGLAASASPEAYERALTEAAPRLGMEPFVIDQIVWYTAARSGEASGESAPDARTCR